MYFIKRNPLPGSRSLSCEARGLKEISSHFDRHALKTPRIIEATPEKLVLERIDSASPSSSTSINFGKALAKMHQVSSSTFGLDEDNYIGLSPQVNSPSDNWADFWWRNRMRYQADRLPPQFSPLREKVLVLEEPITTFLNKYKVQPSLLHGDLWSGNALFTKDDFWVIDPAIYYGDPETDLAMMKLFGGFSPLVYEGYHEILPQKEGQEIRLPIYQLYHLLNHLNIFGASYLTQTQNTLETIENSLA